MQLMKNGLFQISDASVGLGIALICFGLITVPAIYAFNKDQEYSTAASHALRVEKATNKYIIEKAAIVSAGSTPTSPFTLNVPMLITAGYLPTGFSPQNNFSNTYKTLVYQPAPQKFHHMIFLESGVKQNLSAARKIATRIGGSGGYIEDGIAKGVLGAWSEKLSTFGGYNPGNGHVVIAGFFSNGAVVNDYLYRKSVPNHPELNTMSTALNMGGNDLNAIKNLNATGTAKINGDIISGGNISTSKAIMAMRNISSQGTVTAANANIAGETTTGGWFRTQGDTGWYSQKWGGGWHMADAKWLRAYGGKSIYSSGQIRGGTVAAEGRLSTGEFLQLDKVSIAGTGCPTNGLLSRNAAGAMLSCQDGVWKSSGGLQRNQCNWYYFDNNGQQQISCPTGQYMAGFSRYKENDWPRTGHFYIECCA